MPYGKINAAQEECLKKLVVGKVVYDLGAGDLILAHKLIKLGAAKVIAIEKENFFIDNVAPEIEVRQQYFRDMDEDIDVAFVSWPSNYDSGLLEVLKRTKTIIYLGTNMDGNSCGTPAMFEYLSKRNGVQFIGTPVSSNTLICYTDVITEPRELFEEEKAAIAQANPSAPITYSRMIYTDVS